jgi:hypothetical protein
MQAPARGVHEPWQKRKIVWCAEFRRLFVGFSTLLAASLPLLANP